MKAYWDNLGRRDQLALLLLGGVFALYLVWLLVVKPVAASVDQARLRALAATESLARVQTMAARLQAYNSGSSQQQRPTGNLADVVNRSLQANQLAMSGFTPGKDSEARLRLDNVAFNKLLGWLNQLESEYAVSVLELTVNPSRDSGFVSASVRLRKD